MTCRDEIQKKCFNIRGKIIVNKSFINWKKDLEGERVSSFFILVLFFLKY